MGRAAEWGSRKAVLLLAVALLACGARNTRGTGGAGLEDPFERDRQAILAMAGRFRVTFQFRETVPLREGYQLAEPYRTSGAELVQVLEDNGRRIVLQHLLQTEDGQVVKHWRQDWHYEDRLLYEFRGRRTWAPRVLTGDVRGGWTQSVFEVDDSPRYEGVGRWVHEQNLSAWESETTWRPLPRREYTQRGDYDVVVARNRHTLTPSGWVHEQDNLKRVLDGGEEPLLVREAGLNVYERAEGADFTPAEAYWRDTRLFWRDVRAQWAELLDGRRTIRLAAQVDDKPLWAHLFAEAEALRDGARYDSAQARTRIRAIVGRFLTDAAGVAERRPSSEWDLRLSIPD